MSTAWRILLFLSVSLDVIPSLTHAHFVKYIYIQLMLGPRMSLRNSITPYHPDAKRPFQPLSFFCRVSADCLTVCSYSFHPWQVLEHIAHLGICWHDANSLIGPGFMSCQWNNLQVEPGHTRPILLVHRSERSSGRNSWIELAKYTQMSTNARANAILGGPGSHPQRHIDGRDGSCPLPCVPHPIPIPAASPEIAEWL